IHGLAPEDITYNAPDIRDLRVRAGSRGNTFTVEDTFTNARGLGVTRIETGLGSDNTVVHRTTGRLQVIGQNGLDGVLISSAPFPAGSLTGILGEIDVDNRDGFTRLNVNAAADNFPHTITLTATATEGRIFGLAQHAMIFYVPNDVSQLILNSGNADDDWFVQGTAGTAFIQLNALGGNDRFIVGSPGNSLDTIQDRLTLNGNTGFDTLIVNDQG